MTSYLLLIEKYTNQQEGFLLKSHAKYFYNFFGSFSTGAGNTFSLENTTGFNYISNGYENSDRLSGISILISSALDITDNGLEDFDFLSRIDGDYLKKLNYRDIYEIRENWLHQDVIDRYEKIVNECALSYMNMKKGNEESAINHIEHAFELREKILSKVKLGVKSEVNAYKIHRASKFLANVGINFLEFASGYKTAKSIAKGMLATTTEIAVLMNREKQLNNLVKAKTKKIKLSRLKAETLMKRKSSTLELLRLIEGKLK